MLAALAACKQLDVVTKLVKCKCSIKWSMCPCKFLYNIVVPSINEKRICEKVIEIETDASSDFSREEEEKPDFEQKPNIPGATLVPCVFVQGQNLTSIQTPASKDTK